MIPSASQLWKADTLTSLLLEKSWKIIGGKITRAEVGKNCFVEALRNLQEAPV